MKKVLVSLIFIACNIALPAQSISISNNSFNSQNFGSDVIVLPNGNFVVQDKLFDKNGAQDVGAVYLYNGKTLALISLLTGDLAFDKIGLNGIVVLDNSNFMVASPNWHNTFGAATFVNGVTGLNGVVSASNSLVGSQPADNVGYRIKRLGNNNFVVVTPAWNNGSFVNAGAITWANGSTGISGVVSAGNSLVGSHSNDFIGDGFGNDIIILANNNFIVKSQTWDNGTVVNAGAVTWVNGNAGINGVVSASNSLVGSSTNDSIGSSGITVLTNGNFVVSSTKWDSPTSINVGAVTWCSGTTGKTGIVSGSNSLVGSTSFDLVGYNPSYNPFDPKSNNVIPLANGNYVVCSSNWDNGGTKDLAGAATWGNGTTGIVGEVNEFNSLVGSRSGDNVGRNVTPLTNGNYVVNSPFWANGNFEKAGAATWGNGTIGITGEINSTNSLVGTKANDLAGGFVNPLMNGNYVVNTRGWSNGLNTNAGAVTWGNGTTGITGFVSSTNSLVGTKTDDRVGVISALPNGNYVVRSQEWDNGTIIDAGAVTWGSGTTGISGVVNSNNSLVGSTLGDAIGWAIQTLPNSNYLINSPYLDNGTIINAGAVTWGNGNAGVSGVVSSSNSLLGATTYASGGIGKIAPTVLSNGNYVVIGDNSATWGNGNTGISGVINNTNSLIGLQFDGKAVALTNGNYVVYNPFWDNGTVTSAGIVSWGNGNTGSIGTISGSNSLVGSTQNDNIGLDGVKALNNGNFLVLSSRWNSPIPNSITDAGAATWGNGNTGITGIVSASNSLVGNKTNDQIGFGNLTQLNNGNYILTSPQWNKGFIENVGAVTWGKGSTGVTGIINSCNSVSGNIASPSASQYFSIAFNYTYNYMLIGKPLENQVDIFDATGMELAINLDTITQTISGNSPTSFVVPGFCRIISALRPDTVNGLNGTVTARVWIESTQPPQFVKRHFEKTSNLNNNNAAGKVTLYFTQQEFTDFNAVNTIKLPIDAADTANNKANLLIEKRTGISSNGTGLPISYSAANTPVTINPADSEIFYNSLFGRWEVSFNIIGFGGLFVKTATGTIPNVYTFNGNGNWSNAANWLGGIIPPAVLTAPNEIIIDPISGGECLLKINTAQTINNGAKISVAGTKKFRMEGNLIIQ